MASQGDDDNWSPPSESDMKILRARRERQDKVSRLMGDYLLKGYRMLGESCDTCGTILLQDKQKKLLCISCQELDSDTEKDNPVLNPQAALSQVREHQLSLQENPASEIPASEVPASEVPACVIPRANIELVHAIPPVLDTIRSAEAALLEKISWATHQLKETTSVEFSSQLSALIGSCAQSLRFLKDLCH